MRLLRAVVWAGAYVIGCALLLAAWPFGRASELLAEGLQ